MSGLIKRALWTIISWMLLVSCQGTIQIGIEVTPTPDRSMPATLTALLAENDRLATRVAAQAASLPTTLELGQLAYVQGGDIWTMTLLDESISPQRLTIDGRNREPRWSPSGKWLAFRKEKTVLTGSPVPATGESSAGLRRQVWLIQADGTSEHPVHQGLSVESFVWSPQGDRLAYTTATSGLNIINADGTDLIALVSDSSTIPSGEQQIGQISWSPDGRWIAYERRSQPASRPLVQQGIWLISAMGGTPIELYNAGIPDKGECYLIGWSALGDRVLFLQNQLPNASLSDGGDLYAISARVNRSADITASRIGDGKVLTYADFVAPAPLSPIWKDQTAVAFIAGQGRGTWANKSIHVLGQSISGADVAAISLAWSPDGLRLAYAAMPERSDLGSADFADLMERRIWVANAIGDPKPRRLTSAAGYRDERPLWSASSNYVLFSRMDSRGQTSLWIVAADGNSPHQVVSELTPAPDPIGSYGHVDWDALFDWWRGP